jgi:hypothetical protein
MVTLQFNRNNVVTGTSDPNKGQDITISNSYGLVQTIPTRSVWLSTTKGESGDDESALGGGVDSIYKYKQ